MHSDVQSALQPWQGKLQPKEESIILSEQQDWKVAMDLFAWFSSQDDYIPNVFRYNIMFKVLGKHRKWDLLSELWNQMFHEGVRPTNVTFSTIINAYTKAGLINQAIAYFEAMPKESIIPDEVTLNTMVNLYKLSGMYSEAESFGKKFLFPEDARASDHNQPTNIETYNTLIDLCGKSGRLADATHAFEEMMSRGIRPNAVTFNTMIHICGTNDRMEEAEALFRKMEEEKCEPDVGTYSILIALLIKAGNIQAAQHAFSRMKSSSILPNTVTYRTLIIGYSLRGLVAEVENLIEEMEKKGFPLNETIMVHLTQMYIAAGNDAKASHYFDRLKLCVGLDDNHFLPLIDAYAERGSWKEAENIFFCAANMGLTRCTSLYNVMIKAYRLGKMYQKAFKLFVSMRERGVEADVATYNTMILTACDASEVGKALLMLSDMKMAGFEPHYSSYTAIVVAYGKEKLVEKAKDVFKEMEEVHPMVDMVAYSAMVNVYADAGMLEEMEATLHGMESAGHIPNCTVYTSVMKLYGKLDMVEQAEKLFTRMESINGGPDLYAKNTLLDIYGKAGMRKAAWSYFQRMQQEGHINQISCNIILTILANESGWDKEALLVATKMLDSRFVTDVLSFNNVIGVFVGNGKQQEAFELFKQMIKQGITPDLRTYDRLKDILENPGLLREAIEELGLARKEDTSNSIHRLIAFTSLYSLAELPVQAMEACTKVMESGVPLSLPACNAFLNAYGSNGQFDLAVRLFMDMQSKGPKPNAVSFTSMLLLYGKEGLVEGVTRLFSRMKQEDCTPDESTFKALIKTYKRAGRFDLVSMATHEMKFVQFLKESGGTILSEGESDMSEEEEVD
ncbi:hypothetical protein GOP47_0007642 [Adiantum capillus-veneris]|uniref:Pentacotripeptide-repeat region of PRORP domain-containing protein n=1 Tax=Adiantum capillus-veneris TaxID=13818 RepID=A0A9D4V1A2_ADICA|nr:hypothetical protein GOP47_0007642 [Adiantum capillus-veneris]